MSAWCGERLAKTPPPACLESYGGGVTRPSDEWRVSGYHFPNVWLDSAIFVLEVPRGILVNDVADEGVNCGLFCFGAVAWVHEANCDATLVVGFFGVLVLLAVLVKEHHVRERGGLDVARELLHLVDGVPEPSAFVVVVASVDGVRRLVGAAVTHFDAERDFVALVGDVVKDGGALFLAANGVVPFFSLAYLCDCDLHGYSLSLACAVRVSRFVSCLLSLYHELGRLARDAFVTLCGVVMYANDVHAW